MSNLLLKLGVTQSEAGVDIYRDGDVVTLVAKGQAVRETKNGKIKTSGMVVQQYETVEAFEADRNELFVKFPLAYNKVIKQLGISDDVKNAPPLPEELRHMLPEHQKALPIKSEVSGIDEDWYKNLINEG